MNNKRQTNKLQNDIKPNSQEIEHRLPCCWNVELEQSGQHKRYLKSLTNDSNIKVDLTRKHLDFG